MAAAAAAGLFLYTPLYKASVTAAASAPSRLLGHTEIHETHTLDPRTISRSSFFTVPSDRALSRALNKLHDNVEDDDDDDDKNAMRSNERVRSRKTTGAYCLPACFPSPRKVVSELLHDDSSSKLPHWFSFAPGLLSCSFPWFGLRPFASCVSVWAFLATLDST